jgi:nitrate/nitrite transport system ATP-binding protein
MPLSERPRPYVEVDHVDRIFRLPGGGSYVALRNIHLEIQRGEFISLIGHSGCGKSTLLNIIAGLDRATQGGIILEGREVRDPGPDRMVVFQNYSLLPWLTVRENIALVVDQVLNHLSQSERRDCIDHHMRLVGLQAASDQRPTQLSGGMKQRVAIARALATRPKLLLLDEPFGALDALTRGNLQEQLMQICQESQVTCIMVTHDVDEALLLSDRVVMLTNGPEAHIGQILVAPFPRPRHRLEVVNDPSYYALRGEMIYFLNQQKRAKQRKEPTRVAIARHGLEKVNLEIGFIPLTDCAPLIVAKEKGFFAKHGLEQVTLSREPNWKAIAEGVACGRLDAAQMVAGMPLALTLGLGGSPIPVISGLTLSRNGNAITLSRRFLEEGVRRLEDFRQAILRSSDTVHTLGIVHPASMHNLMLRYWLASGGIDPDQEVSLTVISPAQMVANLKAGTIDGYCVGDPWNSRAVHQQIGYVIATDLDIWPDHPEKVLGVHEQWARQHPQTHLALIRALLEACSYCDEWRYREEIVELLCRPEYLGTTPEYTRPGFLDPYGRGTEDPPERLLSFNTFHVHKANCPDSTEALWILTQLARWDLLPFPRNWLEIVERVQRADLYSEAARQLGWPGLVRERNSITLFDGVSLDPDTPLQYLQQFSIKRQFRVEEILLDRSALSVV